jgi:hypothetical protein
MRNRLRARFVAVIDEVALRIAPGVLGDDLDRVLVGADRAVGAQAIEHRAGDIGAIDVESGIERKTGARDIVCDADSEAAAWLILLQFVEGRLCHRWGEILG